MILKRKLDMFLHKAGGGKVVDITFIPDYKRLLELEIKKAEINDLKKLISTEDESLLKKVFLPKIYRSETAIKNKLEEIENQFQIEIQHPVYSSGHAFICFDSLLSAFLCLNSYQYFYYFK